VAGRLAAALSSAPLYHRSMRQPHSLSPRALAIAGWTALVVGGLIFLAIAWNVTTRSTLAAIDMRVAELLHADAHASGARAGFFLVFTHLHGVAAIALWSAIFGVVLWRLGERYWLLTLAVTVAGGELVNFILKQAYERLRPQLAQPFVSLESYSFPSGHTAGAVLFYGVLAAFLVSRFYDWRRRAAALAAAMMMVALVAFSQLYLGAHYLSDVLAAMCSSTVWLVLCLAGGALQRIDAIGELVLLRRQPPQPILIAATVPFEPVDLVGDTPLAVGYLLRLELQLAGGALLGVNVAAAELPFHLPQRVGRLLSARRSGLGIPALQIVGCGAHFVRGAAHLARALAGGTLIGAASAALPRGGRLDLFFELLDLLPELLLLARQALELTLQVFVLQLRLRQLRLLPCELLLTPGQFAHPIERIASRFVLFRRFRGLRCLVIRPLLPL